MKIVTWNCNGAFRKKFESLNEFQADIIIIQECENPEQSNDKKYRNWATNYQWTGENKNKGLGVFAKNDIQLERLDWKSDGLKYFIPCRINDDFLLLASWCHGANSPTFGYIGQLWKYMQMHKSKFNKSIVAGDLNSNVIWDRWDRWWNHTDVVRELKEIQIESLYHQYFKEEAGKETQPTLFLQRKLEKPYHIDYVFASNELSKSLINMTIGQSDKWLETSDHMPVYCEFEL
ncbi:MAG: endonuclease/exonuclease/phosphatase family protein [Candidatus Heimdallarchaeota archaeon]|nr:endonuclease/exonuclease/phosphatase family protein [Candidatus Heimdallarchaeota archaeon]